MLIICIGILKILDKQFKNCFLFISILFYLTIGTYTLVDYHKQTL